MNFTVNVENRAPAVSGFCRDVVLVSHQSKRDVVGQIGGAGCLDDLQLRANQNPDDDIERGSDH